MSNVSFFNLTYVIPRVSIALYLGSLKPRAWPDNRARRFTTALIHTIGGWAEPDIGLVRFDFGAGV